MVTKQKAPLAAPARSEPVRPRRRRDEDDDFEVPRGVPVGWIVGGIAAFVLLVGGGVTAALLMHNKPAEPVAINDPPHGNNNPKDEGPKKDGGFPQRKPGQQPKPEEIGRPQPQFPVKQEEPIFKPDPKPRPVVPPVVVPDWKATADPLPQPVTLPDATKGAIPIAGFTHLALFPSAPSPFVLVSQLQGPTSFYEVWDLRNVKKVGVFTLGAGKLLSEPYALSPDGSLVACKPGAGVQAGRGTLVHGERPAHRRHHGR